MTWAMMFIIFYAGETFKVERLDFPDRKTCVEAGEDLSAKIRAVSGKAYPAFGCYQVQK